MDISHRDAYGTKQPRGGATTLLDLVSRDDQDTTIFPLTTNITRFTRDESLRTIPFSSVIREFLFNGPAKFGQTFVFELDELRCGDLIQGLFIQVQLGSWFTELVRMNLEQGIYSYKTPQDAWTYSNALGTAILEEATLEVDDQILERITGNSTNVVSILFPDLNSQVGMSDVEGYKSIGDVKAWTGSRCLPTEDRWITVPLLFSMLRERLTATFPLIACRSGTIRVKVTLKRFDQIVRNISGKRISCDDTPLGKNIVLNNHTIFPIITMKTDNGYNSRGGDTSHFLNSNQIIILTSTPKHPSIGNIITGNFIQNGTTITNITQTIAQSDITLPAIIITLSKPLVGISEKAGDIFTYTATVPTTVSVVTPMIPPDIVNIQLLTYGIFVDGPYREMLLRQPFERPFREIQQFDFTEPLKYLVNKTGQDSIQIQLPLEANQPVEEIVWFLRRKAAITLNNDWVNYSATLEKDYDPVFSPLEPLLSYAKIQANGMDIVSQDESWFRSHISRAHKGGKVAYDSYIYGYSFAQHPAEHNPSGTINASRLNSLRLTLDVKPPGGASDTEWEVRVFVFAFQWIRFGNGICNKVFID